MGVTDCPGVQREASCSISSFSAVTVLQLTHVAQLERKGTQRCGTSPSRVRRTTDCRISRLSRFALCTLLGSVEYLLRSALLSLPCAGTQSQYRRPAPSSDDTNRQRSRWLLWRSSKQHSDDKYYLSTVHSRLCLCLQNPDHECSDETNRQRSSKMFPDCWSIVVSSWCHLVIPIDREADHSADLV